MQPVVDNSPMANALLIPEQQIDREQTSEISAQGTDIAILKAIHELLVCLFFILPYHGG